MAPGVEVVEGAPATLDQIREMVIPLLEENTTKINEGIDARIEELSKPVTRDVPELGVRVVSRGQPTDRLYARMSSALQFWRSDESDHWMANWLRGMAGTKIGLEPRRAHELKAEAAGKLEEIYGRATGLEGVPDSDGGVADGTVGDLIPVPLLNVVQIERDRVAKIRGLATNFTLTNQQARIPTMGAVTTAMVAEGATAAQGEPTNATILPRANKMQAFMKISIEALADVASNIITLWAQRAGASMGALEDVQFMTSNGSAPNISEKITGIDFAEATPGVLVYADVVGLYRSVPEQYRAQASWLAGSDVLTLLDLLLDGNGRPIFSLNSGVVGVTGNDGADSTIFRKAVFEVPITGVLIFGDIGSYGVGTRSGMTTAMSEHSDFAADLIAFKFTQRLDGIMLDTAAIHQISGL